MPKKYIILKLNSKLRVLFFFLLPRMLVLLYSIFLISTFSAASQSVVLNCKRVRKNICYNNNNIEISEQGMQIQQNDKTKYETLFVSGAEVKFLPTNIATTFPDLKVLKVVQSSLQIIEKSNFEGLNGVTELNLEKNLIQILTADVFKPLENLKKINLNQNKISSLTSKIFEGNTKLVSISANGNMIKSISNQAFKNLIQLKSIHISNNQIEDLHSGTFDDCVELKTLSIHSNKLRYVPEKIFVKNPNLEASRKYFENNTCIDSYLVHGELSSLSDLTDAFKDHCRPQCYGEVEELENNVKSLETKLAEAKQCKGKLETKEDELGKANKNLEDSKVEILKFKNEGEDCKKMIEEFKSNQTLFNQMLKDNNETIKNMKEAETTLKSTIINLNQTIEQLNLQIKNQNESQVEFNETCHINVSKMEKTLFTQFQKSNKLEEDVNNCSNQVSILTSQLINANKTLIENDQKLVSLTNDLEIRILAFKALKDESTKNQCSLNGSLKVEDNENVLKLKRENTEWSEKFNNLTDDYSGLNKTEADCRLRMSSLEILNQSMKQEINQLNDQLNKTKSENDQRIKIIEDEFKACNESKITANPELPKDNSYSIKCNIEKNDEYLTCGVNDVQLKSSDIKVQNISSNLDVIGLKFTDSKFIEIPDELVKKFENFKYFKATKSMFLNFNEDICEYSSKIEIFSVTSSVIGWTIKLDKCELLNTLQIEDSGIREISSEKPIKSLTKINLNSNKIQIITNDFFSKFENLKSIQMSENKISFLNGNIFDGNKLLESINLSKNPIKKINGEIFTQNAKLVNVDFRQLECINKAAYNKNKISDLRGEILSQCR